jgi:hypothetical protein
MSDSILSKVLEVVEGLKLPEGEYLELCNLIKECHKTKENWILIEKEPVLRCGMDFYNEKRKCLSIDIKKTKEWKRNNSDVYSRPPENTYVFEIKHNSIKDESSLESENIFQKETIVDSICDFIKSIMDIHNINKYDVVYKGIILESKEIYTWIKSARERLRKIIKLNHRKHHRDSSDEDSDSDSDCDCTDFNLDDENFIFSMSNDMKKLIKLASI